MNLLTPPTDNLYKFLAIAGVVLMIVSIITPVGYLNRLQSQVWEARTDLAVLRVDEQFLSVDRAGTKSAAKSSTARSVRTRLALDPLTQRERELAKRKAVVEEKTKQIESLNKDVKFVWQVFSVLFSLGFCTSVAGFVWWWTNLQKYQDELLRIDVKKAQHEMAEQEAEGSDTTPERAELPAMTISHSGEASAPAGAA